VTLLPVGTQDVPLTFKMVDDFDFIFGRLQVQKDPNLDVQALVPTGNLNGSIDSL